MDSLQTLHQKMRACRLCYDAGHDIIPGAIFRGSSEARVLLIGQAPGVTEVEAKRPFNASSGRRLFQWLGEAGWDEDEFRDRHYMTAVTKCYPGKGANGKGDRVPSKAEQALCRPFLEREVALVNPRLIILVGGLAIKLIYPNSAKLKEVTGTAVYFPPKPTTHPLNRSLKTAIPIHNPQSLPQNNEGHYIVPLPHPSGASLWPNKPANKTLIAKSIQLLHHFRIELSL
jgi:uracil-DNA glycosylase family 4